MLDQLISLVNIFLSVFLRFAIQKPFQLFFWLNYTIAKLHLPGRPFCLPHRRRCLDATRLYIMRSHLTHCWWCMHLTVHFCHFARSNGVNFDRRVLVCAELWAVVSFNGESKLANAFIAGFNEILLGWRFGGKEWGFTWFLWL